MVSLAWEKWEHMNTYAHMDCRSVYTQTHTHTQKRNTTGKNIQPIKNLSELDGFHSARCLHLGLRQQFTATPPTPHFTACILPLPLFPVCNASLVIPSSSPEPPSAPQQLISVVNETSVVLEWAPPRRLGGRSDTSYSLECLICQTGSPSQNGGKSLFGNRSISQPEAQHSGLGMQSDQGIVGSEVQAGRSVIQSRPSPGDYPRPSSGSSSQLCLSCGADVLFSPGQIGLKTTRVVVSELRAHTHYTFIVHARNGVSQSSGTGSSQSVSVTVTTNQAGEKCAHVCSSDGCMSQQYKVSHVDVVHKWVSVTQTAVHCMWDCREARPHG